MMGIRTPYLVFVYSGMYVNIYREAGYWGFELYDESELMIIGNGMSWEEWSIGELVAYLVAKVDELKGGRYLA